MLDKKVVIHGSYFVNNFGDTLLVKLLADRVANYVGKGNVRLATTGLEVEQESIGYPVISKAEESSASRVIYSGGGYLGEPNVGGIAKLKWVARNYFRHFSWNSRFTKAEFHVLGVGVGPIDNFIYRGLAGRFLRRCRTVLVRDQESLGYCQKYFDLSGLDVCVGMALSTPVRGNDKKGIAVHLDTASLSVVEEVLSYIKRQSSDYASVPLKIIFDNDAGSTPENMAKYQAALEKAGYKEGDYEIYTYKGMDCLIDILAGSELVVTSKLHVGIVTISQKGKVIAVPKHSKTKRLYAQLSLSKYCIEHDVFNLEAFDGAFQSLGGFTPNSQVITEGIDLLDKSIEKMFS